MHFAGVGEHELNNLDSRRGNMKVAIIEFDGCFAVELEAENMDDAAMLMRFGANTTKELRSVNVYAQKGGVFEGSVVFGKRKNASSRINR
jgi:hypothetical protein